MSGSQVVETFLNSCKLIERLPLPRPEQTSIESPVGLLKTTVRNLPYEIVELYARIKENLKYDQQLGNQMKRDVNNVKRLGYNRSMTDSEFSSLKDLYKGEFKNPPVHYFTWLCFGIATYQVTIVGVNELGLTVRIGNSEEKLMCPAVLARVLEEEMLLLSCDTTNETDCVKIRELCHHALMTEIEKYVITCHEMILASRETARRLHEDSLNVAIANTASSVTMLSGGVVTLVGLGLAPVTMGASTVLVITRMGLAGAGIAMYAGTEIGSAVMKHKILSGTPEENAGKEEEMKEILFANAESAQVLGSLIKSIVEQSTKTTVAKAGPSVAHVAMHTGRVTAEHVLHVSMKFGIPAIGVVLDFVNTIENIISLSREAKSELGFAIENNADDIEENLVEIVNNFAKHY